jgi:hypothetical protein
MDLGEIPDRTAPLTASASTVRCAVGITYMRAVWGNAVDNWTMTIVPPPAVQRANRGNRYGRLDPAKSVRGIRRVSTGTDQQGETP